MKIDVIIPVKSSLVDYLIKRTIPSIMSKLNYNNIYIITKKENIDKISNHYPQLLVIDEDTLCENLSFGKVDDYLKNRVGNSTRTGWYFQQFLKLGIALKEEITENYLIWDADAILLKRVSFFNKNKQIYVSFAREHHKAYFRTIKHLIGIPKQIKTSFISEHMVFTKTHVKNLLLNINKNKNISWWENILTSIEQEDMLPSGFSEYETYGTYIMKTHPELFKLRKLIRLRTGTLLLGNIPPKFILIILSSIYTYVSFEFKQKKSKK